MNPLSKSLSRLFGFPLLLTAIAVSGAPVGATELPQHYFPSSLEVVFEPQEAANSVEWQLAAERDASGEWETREDLWHRVGFVEVGLPPGKYGLVFRAADGWATPSPVDQIIPPGGEVSRTVVVRQLPAFDRGEVPPQSVRQGETLSFRVNGASSVSVEAHPDVTRDVSLEDGIFVYRPAPEERRPFKVTLDAGSAGEQEVVITPSGASEAEQEVLRYEANLPDPEARSYLHVTVESRSARPALNHDQSTVRDVAISGPRVVFAPGHGNGLYDGLLGLDGDRDIATLTIFADQVVIAGAELHLPQTDVTIHARELHFEGAGSLNTTPIQKSGTASSGARGPDGSTVTLNVGGVFIPENTENVKRLILRGGDGQVGTAGRNGTPLSNRKSFTTYSSNVTSNFLGTVRTAPAFPSSWRGRVTRRVVKETCAISIVRSDVGTSSCPRSGNAAVANGVSGNGGNGGQLRVPFDLGSMTDLSRGTAGPSYPRRTGSLADSPVNARQVEISFNCVGVFGSWRSIKACGNVNGANQPATSPPGPNPVNGAASFDVSPASWLHPIAIRSLLEFTRDVYLNGYYERARELLEPYVAALETLAEDEKSVELIQVEQEMGTLLHRLDSQLDYFGNPAGWVPILSFEVLFGLYEREVESAGDVLYLTHFLGQRADEVIDRAATIVRLRNELEEEIETFREDLEETKRAIDNLKETAENMEKMIGEARVNLDNRRQQLEAEAQFNAGLKKAFRVAGAVLPMIPVAQPALAIAGTALTTASKFNEEPPESLVTEFIGSAIPIGVEDFLREDEVPETDEQKKAAKLQKRAQFAMAAVTGVVEIAREARSWESDVEAELDLLVSRDPKSKGIAAEIRKLNGEKLRFAEKLLAATQNARRLMEGIAQNYLARENLNREAVVLDGKIDQEAFCYIREIERRAKDRLLFYQYLMARAFEYRMLNTSHGVNFQLDRLFEFYGELTTPQTIPENPAATIISHLEFNGDRLIDIYTEELRAITRQVVEQLLDKGVERSATTFYFLNEDQLDQLNRERSFVLNLRETPIFNLQGDLIRFGIFGDDKDSVRIRNLSVDTRDIRVSSSAGISPNDAVEILITHGGESRMDFEGKVYKFNHKQTTEREDLFWKATYFPSRDRVQPDEPAAATNSLIENLLLGRSGDDILTYSRKGAWADLTIRLSTTNPDIVVDELTLTVDYDYLPKKSGRASLEVRAFTDAQDALTPRIVVSEMDQNGRRDGRGAFQRAFDAGTAITLEAPDAYGAYVFDRWVQGTTTLGTHPVLDVDLPPGNLPSVTQVRAVYRLADGTPPPARGLFSRGDPNIDEAVNLNDVFAILNFLFRDASLRCMKAGDTNDDGEVDISDAVTLLVYLFLDGEVPSAPFGACGADPTGDGLTCRSFFPCQQ